MLASTDTLLARRAEFPILSRCTYLISNSLGAMPAAARTNLMRYADDWSTSGVEAWPEWLALVEEVGDLVAPLLGAPARSVMMLPNVTIAEAVLISCLDFSGRRNKVVYSELEFPTVHYIWQAQAERGARCEIVPSPDGIRVDAEALCDAIDETTLAVPISHVLFRSGYIQDVAPIVEKAHRVGAFVFLDVYQSIGVVPIDLRAWQPDAVVGGCLKWLCGGPGAAFLYVRPDLYDVLRPTQVGWFSHERPFDFDMVELRLSPSMWRYAGGTPNPAALYAARAGLQVINDVGVDAIRRRNQELTAQGAALAEEQGLRLNSPRDRDHRGGHVTVDCDGAEALSRELIERAFLVDYRPRAGIRIAPHFYTGGDEIDAVFAELKRLRAGR